MCQQVVSRYSAAERCRMRHEMQWVMSLINEDLAVDADRRRPDRPARRDAPCEHLFAATKRVAREAGSYFALDDVQRLLVTFRHDRPLEAVHLFDPRKRRVHHGRRSRSSATNAL